MTHDPEYLDAYFDAVFGVSIPRKGLSGEVSRRVAGSLARNIGTAATLATIADDARLYTRDAKAAVELASAHVNALEKLYVVESLDGWDAPIRSKSRLRTKPKRYFANSSLVASLLNITPERLLEDGQLFGLLFESLAIHDLAIYARAIPGAPASPLHYYRDSNGIEVDAVIELRDGRWAPIEIKLGEQMVSEGIEAIRRLRGKVAANPAARIPEPAFSAVIVGAGEQARYDKEADVFVIPLTALGA